GGSYSVSGRVVEAVGSGFSGLSGVTINLTGAATASTTTDGSGNYSFSTLANGGYTITPSKSGYSFSPVNRAVTVSGANVAGQNFTASPGGPVNNPPNTPASPSPANGATGVSTTPTLSWTGGDPDAGNTVTYDVYFGTAASPPLVVSNNATTSYVPGALVAGTLYYWRIVARDNLGATTSGPTWNFITAGGGGGGSFSISGRAVTALGSGFSGLSGVTISLTGAATASTATDGSGNYSFAGLANGAYILTPSKTGYTFSPVNRAVTISGANVTGQNFTGTGP
ncbi:MAG: carboxypeptidase regulatory-like domain-containing protein, partial [Gammaproteobacteria bacterium]|nr:carboxypeptidase regulatory-like domain-containing protein [Gammaproteobacteria bacterium]